MGAIGANNDVIIYQGYQFPNSFTSSSTSARFIYDTAGRTVTHTIVTIKVTSKIAAGANQNATLSTIRAALERPGGSLTYTGKGYDIQVNQNGQPSDVRWGPRPQVLEWKTLGGAYAAEITWQCEVALNNCSNASWQSKLLEYTYSLQIDTDESGYTTKTHSGKIVIPMTRVNVAGGAIPDTADNYFDFVVPPTLPNFKRTISRTLNEAKDTLTFSVTDTEQAGNPLPEGVISAEASHRFNTINTGRPAAIFNRWTATLSATYELVKGKPRSDAFQIFMKMLFDRAAADRRDGFLYFPVSMEISEPEIYGHSGASFSFTYNLMRSDNTGKSQNFFPKSGIWRPVPNSNWNKWTTSLGLARSNRGIAGLRHKASDDVIVDLCLNNGTGGQSSSVMTGVSGESTSVLKTKNPQVSYPILAQGLGIPSQLPVLGSWLEYDCRLIVEPVDHNVYHKPLPISSANSNPLDTAVQSSVLSTLFSSPAASFYGAPQYSPQTIVQSRGSTDFYLRLVGRAVRAGYEIAPPQIYSVGNGQFMTANHPDAGTYFSTWTAGYTTHPIQAAEWNLRWFIQLPVGNIGINLASPPRPDKPTNIFPGNVR